MKKAVLFDIDGTILDTSEFIFSAIDHTLNKHQLTVDQEKLLSARGKPLVELYKFVFPNEDFEFLAQTHREFQENKHHLVKLFPNIKKVFKKLKKEKIKIAGVTNRSKLSLIKSLKTAGIYKYFDAIVTVEDVQNPKPHKDHPLKALEILGVDNKSAIMIGDTEADILAGKSAGIKTVGVTYGFLGKNIKKYKPDFVIDNIEELLNIV